jgi:hypothetical protein
VGIAVQAGYRWTTFNWENNPFFHRTHFQEVNIGLWGFTRCIPCWLWKGGFWIWDQLEMWAPGRFASYDSFAWGRYDYRPGLGLHIGYLALIGKRTAFVRPIIGFDWQISNRLKLVAVYPIDMALNYQLTPELSFAPAFRFFRTRMRLQRSEPDPYGTFEYRAWGAEFRMDYNAKEAVKVQFFVGSMISAWVKVNGAGGNRLAYREPRSTAYAGIQGSIRF